MVCCPETCDLSRQSPPGGGCSHRGGLVRRLLENLEHLPLQRSAVHRSPALERPKHMLWDVSDQYVGHRDLLAIMMLACEFFALIHRTTSIRRTP